MTGLSQISDKLVSPQVNQLVLSHPADTPLLLDTRRTYNLPTQLPTKYDDGSTDVIDDINNADNIIMQG